MRNMAKARTFVLSMILLGKYCFQTKYSIEPIKVEMEFVSVNFTIYNQTFMTTLDHLSNDIPSIEVEC